MLSRSLVSFSGGSSAWRHPCISERAFSFLLQETVCGEGEGASAFSFAGARHPFILRWRPPSLSPGNASQSRTTEQSQDMPAALTRKVTRGSGYLWSRCCIVVAPATAAQRQLRAPVTRLRQLTQLRTAQSNQRRLVEDEDVQAGFGELLTLINGQIQALARQAAALIDADPLWKQLDRAFRTVRGVADRTVARIMAELPEIGALPNKTVSKLAGLAPLANDSGKHKGHRPVRGGRSSVREILFVVASVAGRYEPDFIAFRQRLAQQGKPPKVIRIALAHKLLVRLNAKAREVRKQLQIA